MDADAWSGRETGFVSIRSLLATNMPGRIKIRDVIFSSSSLRICCFKARVRSLIVPRTRLLDASSARLSGDSFVIRDSYVSEQPPETFEFASQGWVLTSDEHRIGDVMDILVDSKLRIAEFTVGLRHDLVLARDVANLLPKKTQKEFMRSIPDVASSTKPPYTVVSIPIGKVLSVRGATSYYEVLVDLAMQDLESAVLRALETGKKEKGLIGTVFKELLSKGY